MEIKTTQRYHFFLPFILEKIQKALEKDPTNVFAQECKIRLFVETDRFADAQDDLDIIDVIGTKNIAFSDINLSISF